MSPGLFASMAESSPSSSPPDLPSRKRYWGTSELVEDDKEDDKEEDDEEEDEEIEESSDSDSETEDAEDDGPTAEDEDPAAGGDGLATGDEGPGMRVESLSLGGDEAVPEGHQRAAPVVETAMGQSSGSVPESKRPERVSAHRQPILTTWIDLEDGIAYIDVHAYPPPAPPAQTPPLPEWSSGSLPVSPTPSIPQSRGQVRCVLALERVTVTFGAIWRPVLALESWAGQTCNTPKLGRHGIWVESVTS
ncbi:hypothetical protein Tco_0029829 [Tanacetum coccineum]